MGNPNRPEPGASKKSERRSSKGVETGDPTRDGYTVIARAPRIPGAAEPVSPEQANRIETIVRDFNRPRNK